MIDFHNKPYHFKSDHVGDPNKPQEGSHKTSSAFKVKYVRDHIQIDIYRDEFFCGQKGGITVATFYKIER